MVYETKFKPLLIVLAICSFFVGLDAMVVSPLAPTISLALHFDPAYGGLLITAYALFYGLSSPLLGPFSDRYGRKTMMIAGIIVFTMGTVLTGLAGGFKAIILFRGITGLGGAMLMPNVFALIADHVDYNKRGAAMGMIMAASVGSTVIGVPIGAFLAQLGSWHTTFFIIGIGSFGVYILILKFIPIGQRPHTELGETKWRSIFSSIWSQFKLALSNRTVLFALLSTFLWTSGLQGMFSSIGLYYSRNFNLDVKSIGIVILFAGIASIIGNVIGGRISDKIGKRLVVMIASLLASFGVFAFSTITHPLSIAILIHICWSFTVGFGQASLTAYVSDLHPNVRGTVLSFNSSSMYMGMMFSSAIASNILKVGEFLNIGILCAFSNLLVFVIVCFFLKETHYASN